MYEGAVHGIQFTIIAPFINEKNNFTKWTSKTIYKAIPFENKMKIESSFFYLFRFQLKIQAA